MMTSMDVLARHKFDVKAFYRMAETGIIGGEDRVELIDGELIDMAPIGDDHVKMVNVLNELLVVACLGRATVSVQNTARLSFFDAPQPDFAVFRGRADLFRDSFPLRPEDILLVVEVAKTSLSYDRSVKLRLYATTGIPEYWIVDLDNLSVTVYREPIQDGYANVTTVTASTRLPLAADPDIVLDLQRILG